VAAPAALPPEYETWGLGAARVVVRRDIASAVRAALEQCGSLYAWAEAQPGREAFTGRGATYAIALGGVPAVVRHARRGGLLGPLLADRYGGAPRYLRELTWSRRLAGAGIPTPPFLAGVAYAAGLTHRADVATERVPGLDLTGHLFADVPLTPDARDAIWRAVGHLVRRLHDAGWVHPDLQLRNVLVGGTPPRAWLLDVEAVREGRSAAARHRNLGRFYRSWSKWNRLWGPRIDADDWTSFQTGYAEGR
jgi:3-deoxy-D-manno-octulosonic acid kinase